MHTRHSLALSSRLFPPGATVVDWGSGGGLPGIPLAIRFPDVQFVLVDSIGKKTDVIAAICRKLGLDNVAIEQTRAEMWQGVCDYAVSRATAPLATLWQWTSRVLRRESEIGGLGVDMWRSGLIALKGGDLEEEIGDLRENNPSVEIAVMPLVDLLGDAFRNKFIVEVRGDSSAPE